MSSRAPWRWLQIFARRSLLGERRANLNVAKARRGCAVPGSHGLHGLPLAAIRRAPQCPMLFRTNRIAGIPELRGNSPVTGILQHANFLSAFDFPADLRGKLKLVAPVINGPRFIRLHENALVSIGDETVLLPRAGKQTDVGHANDGQAIPALRAHGSRR